MSSYKPTPEEDQRLSNATSEYMNGLKITDYHPAGLAYFSYYQGRLDELAENKDRSMLIPLDTSQKVLRLDLERFSKLSAERAEQGFKTYKNVPITYWTTALAGEVGELCNMIKKMERVAHGGIDGGSSYTAASLTSDDLKEEVGGIFIYLDLLAGLLGVNLSDAVIHTFNSKSEKYGFPQLYEPEEAEAPAARPTLPDHHGPDVLPEDIKAHLEEKIRPYHSRQSFIAGCIELWEYLQAPQQPTETPAPGENNIELAAEEYAKGFDKEWYGEAIEDAFIAGAKFYINKKEAVPDQLGEVPEEVYQWILDEAERTYDEGEHLQDFISGMTTMYHRDQDERDCLKSEIMGYKKVYALAVQEGNAFQEQIKALQSQIAKYRESIGKAVSELAAGYPNTAIARLNDMIR